MNLSPPPKNEKQKHQQQTVWHHLKGLICFVMRYEIIVSYIVRRCASIKRKIYYDSKFGGVGFGNVAIKYIFSCANPTHVYFAF